MTVSIRTLCQIASGRDAFLKAAADGDEASTLLAAIVKTPLTIAVRSGVSVELVISACIRAHVGGLLIQLKTNRKRREYQRNERKKAALGGRNRPTKAVNVMYYAVRIVFVANIYGRAGFLNPHW